MAKKQPAFEQKDLEVLKDIASEIQDVRNLINDLNDEDLNSNKEIGFKAGMAYAIIDRAEDSLLNLIDKLQDDIDL